VKLSELITVRKGKKPQDITHTPTSGFRRLIQIDDLRPNAEAKYCPIAPEEVVCEATDVLIAWDGANAGTTGFGLEGAVGSTLAILRPNTKQLVTPYLGHFLRANEAYLRSRCKGATVPHIDGPVLGALELPLPLLAEQKRIAGILDHADALRALRRDALAKLDALPAAIFADMFGDTRTRTTHAMHSLCEIAEVVSGVAKGRKFNGRETITVPYLRVANVQAGYLNLDEIKTIEALPTELHELRLVPGDVVMTEGGDFDKLGRGALWNGEVADCIHQNHVFRVRVDANHLQPRYFHDYLQTEASRDYFLKCAKRTTNLASINMRQLKALPVLVPPLALQEEFARRVSGVEQLRSAHRAALAKLDALFAALQHRAFRGEL
jgi:type I restriction enzyme, S subunit